jgi:hypothetical protein
MVVIRSDVMLPLTSIGLSSSSRAAFRAVVVVLAWLALWLSVLVATIERPAAPPASAAEARLSVATASRA